MAFDFPNAPAPNDTFTSAGITWRWDGEKWVSTTTASAVTSFNTRLGAVVLNSADVTGALGYTPYNSGNPSNYQSLTQMNNALANYLLLSGGVMTGTLTLAADPTAPAQAATKNYVDAHAGGTPGTLTPTMNGVANVGTSTLYARQDHVHPSDTSRFATTGGTISGPTTITGATAITGTNTNNVAAAGYVGEYLSAAVGAGSAVALTTGTVVNVTTLSLTAGDWDVRGIAAFTGTSAQCTSQSGGVNTTSATLPGATAGGVVGIATTAVLGNCIYDIAPTRFSLAATTPIYLVANATFTTGAASVYGQISARRVR